MVRWKVKRWTRYCKVNQKLTTKLQVTTRNSQLALCRMLELVQSLTFENLSQHRKYTKPLRQQATPRPCGFTVQQRISWCWGACCKWWASDGEPFVPSSSNANDCFPILFEVLKHFQQEISFVDPNSEFFHCLQMLVFLSVLFLAYILTNGVFAVTPVILIWQRCGESVSPCLEQVGCWVGLHCQCSLHELAEGQVSSSWYTKRYAKTGWKHWKRETFYRQLPEWI